MNFTKDMIAAILADPLANGRTWAPHGIGMLRTYLDPERAYRLNIWHSAMLNAGISTMHDHPWPFTSSVLTGRLTNTRYVRAFGNAPNATEMMEGKIECGRSVDRSAGEVYPMKPGPVVTRLLAQPPEVYVTGDTYRQAPEEIHDTRAEDFTMTVMHRGPAREGCEASVFWPVGQPWGDASRVTSPDEIEWIAGLALDTWRGER